MRMPPISERPTKVRASPNVTERALRIRMIWRSIRDRFFPGRMRLSFIRSEFNLRADSPCVEKGLSERRVERQQDRWPRFLIEVEVAREIPEHARVLPHARPRVGPAVGLRVEPRAAEEVVLDELGVSIEAEHLVIDVAPPREG